MFIVDLCGVYNKRLLLDFLGHWRSVSALVSMACISE